MRHPRHSLTPTYARRFWLAPLLAALVVLSVPTSTLAAATQTAQQASPPSSPPSSRPKIGLVLGGGGARGSAHVGVLRVLEELRIPIDYIAGNSMGAIVGGLYASGMTPDEIAHALTTMDWVDVFDDAPPRPERSFRRKRDDELYAIPHQLGYSDGEIKLPLAYIQGQKFDLALSRLALPAAKVKNFERLPTPFHAVASDIETGKAVVLKSGDLPRAIRASMAVPGAFDPVEINGRLLVDGLVANNVPVDVARNMGADILIVVDVGSGLFKRDQIKNALDVLGQLSNILSERNVELQLATLKPTDIFIKPQLGKLGAGDFDKCGEGIEKGELSAREMIPHLKHLSVDAASYQQFLAQRAVRPAPPVVNFVRLDNQSGIGDETILSRITLQPGQPLDSAQLDKDIGRIYGMDVFESVRYEVVEENGQTGLLLHAKEKSWGPNYLQFGLKLSDSFDGDGYYNLGVLYTRTAINSYNGELRLGFQVGKDASAVVDWYQPISATTPYFVSLIAGVSRNRYSIYNGDDIVSEFNLYRVGAQLSFGRDLSDWGEGRLGFRWSTGRAEVVVGDPTLESYDFRQGELFARLSLDTLDNLNFPTRGRKGLLELSSAQKSLGSDQNYEQARLVYSHAFTWGRNSLVGAVRFNTTFGNNAPLEALYRSGGFLQLSGFQSNQLSGQSSGELALVFFRRILDWKLLPAYIGGSIEYGNVWQRRSDIAFDNALLNGSVFLGADSPIGPLYLGLGFGEGGHATGFLYLGSPF